MPSRTPSFLPRNPLFTTMAAKGATGAGATNPPKVGNWSDAAGYGIITYNGVFTSSGYLGIGGDAATGSLYYNTAGGAQNQHVFRKDATDIAYVDAPAGASNSSLAILITGESAPVRVSVGIANSGGVGFRMLIVPN